METKQDRYTVYVVDDDEQIRRLLVDALESEGHQVHAFPTAESAKAHLATAKITGHAVDVMLLDMKLKPGKMSGHDMLEAMLRSRSPCQTIVVTGKLSPNECSSLVLKGAADVLLKPFGLRDLYEKVVEHGKICRSRRSFLEEPRNEIARTHRDVFLSYSTKNTPEALAIARLLENAEIKVWHADLNLLPGDQWRESLIDALHNCPVFLVLLTPDSQRSVPVTEEIRRAVSRKNKHPDEYLLIPLLLGVGVSECSDALRQYQYVNLSDDDRLVDELQTLRLRIEGFLRTTFRRT